MTQGQDEMGKVSSSRPIEMPAVKTTIVGGRPPGCGKMLGEIPRGIEVLVKKASVDAAFRALLLARRSAAADEIGLKLAPAEAIMLDHVPQAQLEAIINRTRVDPSRRNAFLGRAAGVMLAALGASTALDCTAYSAGVRPPDPNVPAASAPATQPTTRPEIIPAGVRPAPPDLRLIEKVQPVAGLRAVPSPDRPAASQPGTSRPTTTQATTTSQPASQPALTQAEIDDLVKQLADNQYTVRQAAHKKLQDQGLIILPALREALRSDKLDPEARSRLESIVNTLAATTRPVRPVEVYDRIGARVAD